MAVRVVTDSASDLPAEVCADLGIEVVPLTIRFGEEEFVDRYELSAADFWEKVEQSDVLPETAAPSVGAFEETFRRLADEGADGIVCVNLSAALSATMQSAEVAAKALEGGPPVEIVDSASATMGTGMLAMRAAQWARDGADTDTIARRATDERNRMSLYGALDTLEYLKKGGRIGGARALLGSMLSIKPIIEVRDGAVLEGGKVRTRSKALAFLADKLRDANVETMAVMHANAPDIDKFLELLAPIVPLDDVPIGIIGPVVGVHAGPGTIGLAWIEAR